jgi:hypothetical protein
MAVGDEEQKDTVEGEDLIESNGGASVCFCSYANGDENFRVCEQAEWTCP